VRLPGPLAQDLKHIAIVWRVRREETTLHVLDSGMQQAPPALHQCALRGAPVTVAPHRLPMPRSILV